MKQIKSNDFLEGPILPTLMRFGIPVLLALVLQALYGAVDLWVVGRFAENPDVSAVAIGAQTLNIMVATITGLSMGAMAQLAAKIGEKDLKAAADTIGTSIWIFTIIGICASLFLYFVAPTLVSVMHTPDEAVDKTIGYIRICGLGTVFITAYNVISAIFRGMGNSKLPLLFVGIAAIINIILDLIFVISFNMGAEGAALATVISQSISVIIAVAVIKLKGLPFSFGKGNLKLSRQLSKGIFILGIPIAVESFLNEISYLVIIGFVNTLGLIASAGVGVAERLVLFLLLIPTTFISAISAFVAQNIGAGNIQRAKKALWLGMGVATILGASVFFVAFFQGDTISSFFTKDPQVIAASASFLKATAIECLLLALAFCIIGYFIGTGRTTFVLIQGIIANFLVKIAYAYYATTQENPSLFNIGLSTAIAAGTLLITSLIYYYIVRNKEPILDKIEIAH